MKNHIVYVYPNIVAPYICIYACVCMYIYIKLEKNSLKMRGKEKEPSSKGLMFYNVAS